MKDSDRYLKIVEWSEEDNCYLGSALGLIEHCCHGDNEVDVFKQLCVVVDEWVDILKSQHKELPAPIYQHQAAMFIRKVDSSPGNPV